MIRDLETMTEQYPPELPGGPINGVGYTSLKRIRQKLLLAYILPGKAFGGRVSGVGNWSLISRRWHMALPKMKIYVK